jgi:hypothetical protein
MNLTKHRLSSVGIILMMVLDVPAAIAYDLPPVNLGFTSFLDGGPPAGEGLYYSPIFQFYTTDRFNDANGNEILLPTSDGPRQHDLDVFVLLNKFIYQSDLNGPFGSKWGLDVVVPVVGFDLDPGNSLAIQDNSFGIGDVSIGPYLQWDPIMRMMSPFFLHRIEFQFIVPSGKYNDNYELNPGSNIFSFNPYWAATLFLTPSWTVSWRFHYLWNSKNTDPSKRTQNALRAADPGLDVGSIQPGQAVHLNFTSAFAVIPDTFRVGVNGYYLKQITDTEVGGRGIGGRKEEVLGIGPGAIWHLSPDTHLMFNAYFEVYAENRTQGQRFNFRLIQHF